MSASPPPLWWLFAVSIADAHSFIIKTGVFGKPSYNKLRFSFDAFYCKVKPSIVAKWIALEIEADFKDIAPNLLYAAYVSTLKVRPERNTSDFQNFAMDWSDLFGRRKGVSGFSGRS
jgi:hypothetical protein